MNGGAEPLANGGEDPFGDVPTSTDGALAEAQAAFEAAVAEKAERERELTEQRKEQAERDLDKFYDELTDKKALKQAQNREREEALAATDELDARGNPFARVVALIGGASDSADTTCDLGIMRSLLVRLKNDPKRTADAAAAADAADDDVGTDDA